MSDSAPKEEIGYWMGKPISTMSREELLEVIKGLVLEREQKRAQMDIDDRFWREVYSFRPRSQRSPA